MSSRNRFLIHKLVERDYREAYEESNQRSPSLCSFSVGENEKRRTVVCPSEFINVCSNMDTSSEYRIQSNNLLLNPSTPSRRNGVQNVSNQNRIRRRRPDQQLYVPKARREISVSLGHTEQNMTQNNDYKEETQSADVQNVVGTSPVLEPLNPVEVIACCDEENHCIDFDSLANLSVMKKTEDNIDCAACFEIDDERNTFCDDENDFGLMTEVRSTACSHHSGEKVLFTHEHETEENADNLYSQQDDSSRTEDELATVLKSNNEDVRSSVNKHFLSLQNDLCANCDGSSCVLSDCDKAKSNDEDKSNVTEQLSKPVVDVSVSQVPWRRKCSSDGDSWDALYDDAGDCTDLSTLEQLTKTVGKVSIQTPQIDYWSFETNEPCINDEELGHVIEIYGFPTEFKTEDLVMAFSQFTSRGFDIKWVDDAHALGVFSSKVSAQEALLLKHPFVKTRPLSQGIRESRKKAQRCIEFLQPYKPRPETSAFLARRLVAGALGLHVQVTKEQRDKDRQKLREAKERKELTIKQKEAAWDGIVDGT